MSTLNELLARKNALISEQAALEQKIAETQRQERSDAVAKVKALMSEYGLSLADLGSRAPAAPRRAGAKAAGSGTKVAAKYRDPATGDSWTGRGLQPKWLKARLAEGKTLADFTIA